MLLPVSTSTDRPRLSLELDYGSSIQNMAAAHGLIEEFDKWDKSKDGKLSVEEVRNMLTAIGFKSKQAEKFLKRHDKNKDGTMSKEEFAAAIRTMKPEKIQAARLRQLFRQADPDHSGMIKASELKNFVAQFNSQIAQSDVDQWIKQNDGNNDGQLNYEEFVKFMKGRL
ncbi:calmodulin [Paragonimus westermani]|uniref:Calmodulin n=1 Tax=Paragonimus westermani TaxID=34504 RepID=A0A5J4NMD3_9TREM|nr:calmodulin [Paragonimus westermani]